MSLKQFSPEGYANMHRSKNLERSIWQRMHLDMPLTIGLFLLLAMGLLILYSADNQSLTLLLKQTLWVVIALVVMVIFAQIPPRQYAAWAPALFAVGLFLLVAVLIIGHIGKGAQRWLNLGILRFQPSEIMKLAVPMLLAWYLDKVSLPPRFSVFILSCLLMGIPAALIAKQPDLGTAIIIASSGLIVLFLAGLRFRIIIPILLLIAASIPFLWHHLHDYQQQRVLTFLNPERDPLGTGYHIIQSKIAIGSGGLFGKGYLQGTQSHLEFLPEHATDFIFAVCGEELGLIGNLILIALFTLVVLRGLYISSQAQDTFSRLLAGGLSLTFFVSFFVNMGMVSGMLPVVGLPLPLVSYGGTAMITIMAGFGIIMSIHTHRKLLSK